MARRFKTPLAWKNLTHDLRRLALALGGIGFAVLLMCMQMSFQEALYDSTLALIRKFHADLIVTSQAKYTIVVRETFSRRRLKRAMDCPGVISARPLYVETQFSVLKDPTTGVGHPIRVLAFNPDEPVLDLPAVAEHARQLQLPKTALFDRRSKKAYGDITLNRPVELGGVNVTVVGNFMLGTDFANDGNMIMSELNYRELFVPSGPGGDGLGEVDVGLIGLEPGANPVEVKRRLEQWLPDDVKVQTRDEFEEQELNFWKKSTPIGYIFGLGVAMGFVVGVVICYQILYADIADHLAEFATLKAMGYQGSYFIGIVLQEAVLLSLLGFLPGVLASEAVCAIVARETGLLVELKSQIVLLVLFLSMCMCVVSGALTMRKVLSADPAELF